MRAAYPSGRHGPRTPGRNQAGGDPARRDAGRYGQSRGRDRYDQHGRDPGPWWWGSRPGRLGVLAMAGAALLGGLLTVAAGTEPGSLLGIVILIATLLAATAVRPGAAYLVIPLPAPAYLAAAVTAGLYHDRAVDTSLTALAASAVQWAAAGFWLMLAATGAAVLIAAGRWLADRRARN